MFFTTLTIIKSSFFRLLIMKNIVFKGILLTLLVGLYSCGEETVPKPTSQLRLEYPAPNYESLISDCSFQFEVNQSTQIKNNACSFEINYPKMKATIYLTHKFVNNDLNQLLRDAQQLTYKLHTMKADDITEQPFINSEAKIYGMFYKVGGNAATNTLFYATDSVKNFITGSVYFYTKPNYDSILPAAKYVQDDMRHLMETLEWKK